MKVKVISLPYIFQVLYVLCFTRPRYQVSVYRTIGPLVSFMDSFVFIQQVLFRVDFLSVTLDHRVQCPRVGLGGQNLGHLKNHFFLSCNQSSIIFKEQVLFRVDFLPVTSYSRFFFCFLAHLSRRLIGELIVYQWSGIRRRPSVRPSSSVVVHIAQTSSSQKPLGRSKPNFMWSLLG